MKPKKITVIIPVKPGGNVKALESLATVLYPLEFLEILVVYGSQPSLQRNAAARVARGDLLYFLDDDSQVLPGFLHRAVDHFDNPAVAVVGGPSLTPDTDSLLQRSIGRALTSLLGGGGNRNRYRRIGKVRITDDRELILCNLCVRKDLFLSFGGLCEQLYPNEENELMDRLGKAGWSMVYDPDLAIYRSQRRTFRAFFRQMLTYGRGRGEQTLLSRSIKPITFAPSLFLMYLCSLPLLINPVYSIPLLCYALATIFVSAKEAIKVRSIGMFSQLIIIFPALHLLYGAGVIWGLLFPRYRKMRDKPADIIINNVENCDEIRGKCGTKHCGANL